MPYSVFIYETNTERECIKAYHWGMHIIEERSQVLFTYLSYWKIIISLVFWQLTDLTLFHLNHLSGTKDFHWQELYCFLKPSTALGLCQAHTWLIAAITITQFFNRSCYMNSLHCGSSRISQKEPAEKLQFTICTVISVSTLSSLKAALVCHCRTQKTLWGQHTWKRTPYSVASSNCTTEWKNIQLQLRLSLC